MHADTIIAEARKLIGTPWHHAARMPGVGCDCVGLLAVVAKQLRYNASDLEHYSKVPDGESLLRELRARFDEIPNAHAGPSDIVVFTFKSNRVPQHVGLLTDYGLIHSWQSLNKICEHSFDSTWAKRWTHSFRWRADLWQQ